MELREAVAKILAKNPVKIVLGNSTKNNEKYRKATLTATQSGWRQERLTDKQAFHENFAAAELAMRLVALLADFRQLNSFGPAGGYALRISKKGKILLSPTRETAQAGEGHNRKKAALLPEGTVIPPLVDMGVFTREGRVAAGMYDKYRQINRFVELVHHALPQELPPTLRVVDFGCGKSYLTFILYYYLKELRGVNLQMTGLDLKEEVVRNCNEAAQRYGYEGLAFSVGDIADWQGEGVDMVVTLHACDTATDLALAHAVAWRARWIFSVPCCQHELNGQMHTGDLAILTRYGLVQERVAALMTDAVRANLLAACGYKTQLVEFVELEHTPKNILIRAQRANLPEKARREALAEVERLCAAFGFAPALLAELKQRAIL